MARRTEHKPSSASGGFLEDIIGQSHSQLLPFSLLLTNMSMCSVKLALTVGPVYPETVPSLLSREKYAVSPMDVQISKSVIQKKQS